MNAARTHMRAMTDELRRLADGLERPVRLMEICGTHTVNACRSGVHGLMPAEVELVSGPGCPVCVTAQRFIDALVELGRSDDVTLLTYGDMLRVAGAGGSLELARSEGADVRVVTSTLEAVEAARRHPERQMVFAAVGFETTAPATAAAVLEARRDRIRNFTVLACHKLVLPAMHTLLAAPDIRIDGFLCPGHVSVIIGADAYRPVVERHGMPCVVTGFEALQIMDGIVHLVRQVRSGVAELENIYPQVVTREGNRRAQGLIDLVFRRDDAAWRALGVMPESGLELRDEYADLDAFRRFGITLGEDHDPPGCRCGEVITGRCSPAACPLFGRVCTPIYPVGPCMVSSEGTCQAWFKYRRHERRHGVACADPSEAASRSAASCATGPTGARETFR